MIVKDLVVSRGAVEHEQWAPGDVFYNMSPEVLDHINNYEDGKANLLKALDQLKAEIAVIDPVDTE